MDALQLAGAGLAFALSNKTKKKLSPTSSLETHLKSPAALSAMRETSEPTPCADPNFQTSESGIFTSLTPLQLLNLRSA